MRRRASCAPRHRARAARVATPRATAAADGRDSRRLDPRAALYRSAPRPELAAASPVAARCARKSRPASRILRREEARLARHGEPLIDHAAASSRSRTACAAWRARRNRDNARSSPPLDQAKARQDPRSPAPVKARRRRQRRAVEDVLRPVAPAAHVAADAVSVERRAEQARRRATSRNPSAPADAIGRAAALAPISKPAAIGGAVTGKTIAGLWKAPRKCSSAASALVPSRPSDTSQASALPGSMPAIIARVRISTPSGAAARRARATPARRAAPNKRD